MLLVNCEKDYIQTNQTEGYIVGYDPCTINHHYRIGYIIISEDLNDTLITYNLSDDTYQMPASVLINPADTLYRIPYLFFQNFRSSAYFPDSLRFNYKVKISYLIATEDEKVYNICTSEINQADFNNATQVIIKSATK